MEKQWLFSEFQLLYYFIFLGPDDDSIGPEGMEKFCEDIGVEPENVGADVHGTCTWMHACIHAHTHIAY